MKSDASLACLILAGGKATRLGGADKSQLLVNGQTVLSRQLHEIGKVTDHVVLAANHRLSSHDCKLDFVEDKFGGLGPMDGIVGALETLDKEWLWVVACDMPYISKTAFDVLWSQVTPESHFVIPKVNGRIQPLFGLYRKSSYAWLLKCLKAKRLSLTDCFSSYEDDSRLVWVGEEDFSEMGLEFLKNLNTEKDLL